MPTYEYRQHKTGNTMEIVCSMHDERPEAIRPVDDHDGWEACPVDHPNAYLRVFTYAGTSMAPPVGITNCPRGLPVSRSLHRKQRKPGDGSRVVERFGHKMVVHADGTRTNLKGQRVIENREDRRRAEDQTGMRYERDA